MNSDLGMGHIYSTYGIDYTNDTFVDNSGLNLVYTNLPSKWINGIPFSCHTSTLALAEQTCVHISAERFRIVLLLETNFAVGTSYVWRIPLIVNPLSENITLRMNLSLFTYATSSARPQKELFYEIINPYRTKNNQSSHLDYNFSALP